MKFFISILFLISGTTWALNCKSGKYISRFDKYHSLTKKDLDRNYEFLDVPPYLEVIYKNKVLTLLSLKKFQEKRVQQL